MTIQRVHGRVDYWSAWHKINGKFYFAFAPSLDTVIRDIMSDIEKDGHQLSKLVSPYYEIQSKNP